MLRAKPPFKERGRTERFLKESCTKRVERGLAGLGMLGECFTMSAVLRQRYDPSKSMFKEIRRKDPSLGYASLSTFLEGI
jgi:hypothetical protein